jgi:glycolate dehydrogenase FAD-binding subunit
MGTSPLEPVDANQTASMLEDAGRRGLSLVPTGSGTKLGWTRSNSSDAICLSTKRLNAPVQHFAGDLVATIPSGTTLASANAILAQAGQWLPLDPNHAACATIGGIVAANDSGPRRHKYGSPRDLIIGVELALCDGRVARAGGRVVKNVAGYDLSRLVCGSFGSLAVITSATFKLSPLPAASRTVVATCAREADAAHLALTVASQPVTPSAVEIQAPFATLLVRFETTEQAADQMASTTRALLEHGAASTKVLSGEDEREIWNRHESSIWDSPGLVAKLAVLPTDVATSLEVLKGFGSRVEWTAIGRAALGVLLVRVNGAAADEHAVIARLHQHAVANKGTVVVLRGTPGRDVPSLRADDPNLRAVMDAVKARFDPNRVLPALP